MIDRFETLEFDESAIDVYSGKLASMRVPTPDAPLEACVAMNIIDSLAQTKPSSLPAAVVEGMDARVIQFPVRA